jgi:acyl-CoA thioesterase FadM
MDQTQELGAEARRLASPEAVFSYASQVFFDELDPMHMLHNARYAVHVERAISALYPQPRLPL